MNEFFTQPIAIGQLLLNPITFWVTYFGIAYLLRNKINNFGLTNDKWCGPTNGNENSPFGFGKGFLWAYVINVFAIYVIFKWSVYASSYELAELDFPILIVILMVGAFILSFITWLPAWMLAIIATVLGTISVTWDLIGKNIDVNEWARQLLERI